MSWFVEQPTWYLAKGKNSTDVFTVGACGALELKVAMVIVVLMMERQVGTKMEVSVAVVVVVVER